ncbi:MAG TPA: integrase arm-type DNA-binding domain-containing protein [Noviherbaspirillum sp.]|nr:integrase arm-type DNA-binding domain-containing protein [Noviherbaspirillum sp.]
MALNDLQCKNAKETDRPQKLADGEGLYLFIPPNGSKLWRMAYRFGGKQKTLSFGVYPYVTLAAARQKRFDAKQALAEGRDPGAKEAKPEAETFESVARRWFNGQKEQWATSNWTRVQSRLERDCFPAIGAMPIDTIRPPHIVAMCRKVEERGAIEVAKRLKQAVSNVFRFAIAEGIAEFNPASDIGAALKPNPEPKHRAMIGQAGIPALVAAIKSYDGEPVTRIALEFALHTFCRTDEIRFARWSEIEHLDGKAPLWRIPKDRMKMGREHLVPLTPYVVGLLREVEPYREGELIFPGERGAMSANTMIYALYRLGFHGRQTVHGFRRLASTALNEAGWSSDWIERQLAHVESNEIRGIYNAAEWLPGRTKMMAYWSDFLEGKKVRRLAA